ncbi:MAG: hypothetical protein IPG32_07485 [Saprospirales bacterium]|nr:hypothetical protein [Saprospirales bacterium]
MSTTFDIVPIRRADITFGQVFEKAKQRIQEYLLDIGIYKPIKLEAVIHHQKELYVRKALPEDAFFWEQTEYAYFYIEDFPGGTDAYCRLLKDDYPGATWYMFDSLKENSEGIENLQKKLEMAKSLNRHWCFRRSMGQPAIMTICYGLISGAVAELTEGIIWSDDGGWDYRPVESEAFFGFYFRPDKALNKHNAKWASECIEAVQSDYGLEWDE